MDGKKLLFDSHSHTSRIGINGSEEEMEKTVSCQSSLSQTEWLFLSICFYPFGSERPEHWMGVVHDSDGNVCMKSFYSSFSIYKPSAVINWQNQVGSTTLSTWLSVHETHPQPVIIEEGKIDYWRDGMYR